MSRQQLGKLSLTAPVSVPATCTPTWRLLIRSVASWSRLRAPSEPGALGPGSTSGRRLPFLFLERIVELSAQRVVADGRQSCAICLHARCEGLIGSRSPGNIKIMGSYEDPSMTATHVTRKIHQILIVEGYRLPTQLPPTIQMNI